ncbi:T9SS type A sorting domain-containing protein, partial [Flavobacterium sp. J49]|uniref:T9SS type A sorting domain-containing protein n=1 Tax=Flavobacterium sp. J49 TaxID=2718534 RepID=UPI001593C23C
TGTQPEAPQVLCYQTATWNPVSCQYDITGTQPEAPQVLCYQTATWNPVSCQYDITGTQPEAPQVLCYQTATWNPVSCQYDVTGTQPEAPQVLCYQTATWNPVSCQYDVTGTPMTAPTASFVDNCNGTWTITAGNYTGSLLWSTGATTPSITVTVAGTYSVKQLMNGCETEVTLITVVKTCLVGDIYHTGTTCSDFNAGGNDRELEALCYSASNGKIGVVTPGVFFYYTAVVAPSANFTIKVTQAKGNSTSANHYGLMAIKGSNQIILWDPNCNKFTDAGVMSGTNNSQGSLTITNAVPGATYVLSVKYNPKSIQGNTYSGSVAPTVTYNFSTSVDNLNDGIANNYTLVASSQTSVDLVPGCAVDPVANETTARATTSSFSVYPVPFKNELNVKYNFENNSEVVIEVFDVRGVLVQTTTDPNGYYEKEVKIDVNFSKGSNQVYFIRITTNQGTETKKIVSVKE